MHLEVESVCKPFAARMASVWLLSGMGMFMCCQTVPVGEDLATFLASRCGRMGHDVVLEATQLDVCLATQFTCVGLFIGVNAIVGLQAAWVAELSAADPTAVHHHPRILLEVVSEIILHPKGYATVRALVYVAAVAWGVHGCVHFE